MEFLQNHNLWNNSLLTIATSTLIFLAVWMGLQILRRFLRRRWQISISMIVILLVAIHVSIMPLTLGARIEKILSALTALAILFQVAVWGTHLIDYGIQDFLKKRELRTGSVDSSLLTVIPTARFLGRLALYVVIALLALANLGVDITALLAGLGVGGIAVALAVQNILGDLFSSLSIVLDKPFEVGDTIQVQGVTGVVERIGLKTTRLRSVSGEQIIFSNTQILSQQIQNLKRMIERRGICRVGVVYETSPQKLRKVPEILKQCVVKFENRVRFDRASFIGFGPSSLDFELVFFSQSQNAQDLAEVSEAVYFEVFESFERHGLAFAYPTQTVYVTKTNTPAAG